MMTSCLGCQIPADVCRIGRTHNCCNFEDKTVRKRRRSECENLLWEPAAKIRVLSDRSNHPLNTTEYNNSHDGICELKIQKNCKRKRERSSNTETYLTDPIVRSQSNKRLCRHSHSNMLNINLNMIPHESPDQIPLESPDYNSFQYWRPSVPDVELDLASFEESSRCEVSICEVSSDGEEPMQECKGRQPDDADDATSKFNSLLYWKTPVLDIDLDLSSL